MLPKIDSSVVCNPYPGLLHVLRGILRGMKYSILGICTIDYSARVTYNGTGCIPFRMYPFPAESHVTTNDTHVTAPRG